MPKTMQEVFDEEAQRADAEDAQRKSAQMLHALDQAEAQGGATAPAPSGDQYIPNPNPPGFFTHLGRALRDAPEQLAEFGSRGVAGAIDEVGLLSPEVRRDVALSHKDELRRIEQHVDPDLEARPDDSWIGSGRKAVARGVLGAPGMAADMAPIALPGGLGLFATSAGGNTMEDALDAGASPTRARVAGAVSTVANAVLPGVAGKAITPVAAVAGKTVGEALGATAGKVVDGGIHGAVTGEALNVGQAGATAVYDPHAAVEMLEDPTMAVIGAAGGAGGRVPGAMRDRRVAAQDKAVDDFRLWDASHEDAATAPAPGPQMEVPEKIPQDFDPAHPTQQKLLELQGMEGQARRGQAAQPDVADSEAALAKQAEMQAMLASVERAAAARSDLPQNPEEVPIDRAAVPSGYDPELEAINRDVHRAQRERSNQQLAEEEATNLKKRVVGEDVEQGMQEQLRAAEDRRRTLQVQSQSSPEQQAMAKGYLDGEITHGEFAKAKPADPNSITAEHIQSLSRSIDDLRAALTRQHTPVPDPTPKEVPHEVRPPEERPTIHPEEEVPGHGIDAARGQPDGGSERVTSPGEGRAVGEVAEGRQEADASPREEEGQGHAAGVEERGGPAREEVTSSPVGEPAEPAPGHVRMYHGGVPGSEGSRWFINDRTYAEGYAKKSGEAGHITYVDVPRSKLGVDDEFGSWEEKGKPSIAKELPRDVAGEWRTLPVRKSGSEAKAPAAKVAKSKKEAAPAAAQHPRITPDELKAHIDSTPIAKRTPGYSDAMMSLIRARADSAGMSHEDYVGSRFAGVREDRAGSPSLNQGELMQEDGRVQIASKALGDLPYDGLRDAAKSWMQQNLLGHVFKTGDGEPVTINGRGVKKIASGHRSPEDFHAVTAIPETLAAARLVREEPDRAGRAQVQAVQIYEAPVVIDGVNKIAGITILKMTDGRRLYDHMLLSAEKSSLRVADQGAAKKASPGDLPAAEAKETPGLQPREGGKPLDPGVRGSDGSILGSADDGKEPRNLLQDKRLNEAAVGGKSEMVKRGSVEFLKDGRAIITAFEHADESTVLHELGHVFRRDLAGEDKTVAEKWCGVKDGKWTRTAEEKFARGFERYLRDGNAPTPALKSVFAHFYDWLHRVYKTIVHSPIDVKISPEAKALFDRMFKNGEAPTGRREIPSVKPSNDTQAPPSSGPGSDRMKNDRAVETALPGASPEASRPSPKRDPSMNQKDPFGRPDLAKQGATDAGRSVEDQVDEARKQKPTGATPDEVKADAAKADVSSTQKKILERAKAGETYRNDTERAEAKIAVRKAVDEAGTDPEKIKAAARLVNAHRDVMSIWSKIGRQSWDELESPEDRFAHARQDAFEPPRGLAERMRAAQKMADELFQKEGQTQKVARLQKKLDALENKNAARIAKLKRKVKAYGFDLEDKNAAWVHDPGQLQEVKHAIVAANGDTWDAAHEVYLNARHWSLNLINPLGGVKTAADAVSIISHFGIERPLEALFNSVKGSHDSATFREFPEIAKGLAHALTTGVDGALPSVWRSFWTSLKDDTHAFDAELKHHMSDNELHPHGAKSYGQIPGKTGTALRLSIRMIKALDSGMKTLAAHMDVAAEAVRIARRDGIAPEEMADFIKRQVHDNESEAWHNAVRLALRLTFTDKSGPVVNAINKFKYMSPKNAGERALKEAARYQFLFPGIPTRIILRGMAMLPGVGPMMMLGKTGKAIFDLRPTGNGWSYSRGEFNRDLATSAFAGGLATVLGTMVAGAKTDDGRDKVTGFNDKERPTTVNLFGKDWSYKKALGPLAHPVGTAMDFFHAVHTDAHEVDKHGKPISHWGTRERHGDDAPAEANPTDRWHALVASLGEQAVNESMWKSTIDLAKAVGQVSKETATPGEHVTGDKLAKFIGNFVTGFVPTVFKQAGGALNPVAEDRKLEGDFWNRVGQSALYNLDIPGAGQAPPKVGYFGQPITKDTLGGPATTFLWRMTGGMKLGDDPDADTSLGSRVVTRWNEMHEDHPFPTIPTAIHGATEAQRNQILEAAGKATEERISSIQGLNPNEPSFRSMRAILYFHQQEVQRATRKVLGK